MKYFNYMICIPFVIIILYSLMVNWISNIEGFTYYVLGSTVTSTEHPNKTGTITVIPTNSYGKIGIKYPDEATVYVERSSITVKTVPNTTTNERPSWLSESTPETTTTGATTYTYSTLDGTTYAIYNTTISAIDDIPTPGSGFTDETYTYGSISTGSTTYTGSTSYQYTTLETELIPTVRGSDYVSTGSGYSGSTAGTTAYDSLRGTTGSTYSTTTSILLPENDILADYTSPTIQSYIRQDPLGYTSDSATLNKIFQMLSSMATDNHCSTSAFGCCSDSTLAKTDLIGSNCSAALNEDIKTYIDTKLAEKSYTFTPTTSSLLQTALPPTSPNDLASQKSYTNTVFLAAPRGNVSGSCPDPSFGGNITPTYSNVNSAYLPTPLLADFSGFGR